MANIKSSKKRAKQSEQRRQHNRYYLVTARNMIKKLRATKDRKEAEEMLPKVTSRVDKLVKQHIIHKNKASNLKSQLTKHVKSL